MNKMDNDIDLIKQALAWLIEQQVFEMETSGRPSEYDPATYAGFEILRKLQGKYNSEDE